MAAAETFDFWFVDMTKPHHIKTQHPKANISPTKSCIEQLFKLGYVGQRKVNGNSGQFHILEGGKVVAFTRHGNVHTKAVPPEIVKALTSIFKEPIVVEGEWQQQENKVYLYDLVVEHGEYLQFQSYTQRYDRLRAYFALSPNVEFLPVLKTLKGCLDMIADPSGITEGLVFKAAHSIGFSDTAIIRCRKHTLFHPVKRK